MAIAAMQTVVEYPRQVVAMDDAPDQRLLRIQVGIGVSQSLPS
jgi:hypothetical protein